MFPLLIVVVVRITPLCQRNFYFLSLASATNDYLDGGRGEWGGVQVGLILGVCETGNFRAELILTCTTLSRDHLLVPLHCAHLGFIPTS